MQSSDCKRVEKNSQEMDNRLLVRSYFNTGRWETVFEMSDSSIAIAGEHHATHKIPRNSTL